MQVIYWVRALNSETQCNDSDRQMKSANKIFSHSTGPLPYGAKREKKRPVKVQLAQCGILKRAQNILLRLHLDSLADKH